MAPKRFKFFLKLYDKTRTIKSNRSGFKEVRTAVIRHLIEGRIQHEARGRIDEKNLLKVGEVSPKEVVESLKSCRGTEYEKRAHHLDDQIDVHIFKPRKGGYSWYIKCYFLEPDIWFISVHRRKEAMRKRR